jgi:hypothetical protein
MQLEWRDCLNYLCRQQRIASISARCSLQKSVTVKILCTERSVHSTLALLGESVLSTLALLDESTAVVFKELPKEKIWWVQAISTMWSDARPTIR